MMGWGTGGAWGRRGEGLGVSEQYKGEREVLAVLAAKKKVVA
jgi:hypothetical protein